MNRNLRLRTKSNEENAEENYMFKKSRIAFYIILTVLLNGDIDASGNKTVKVGVFNSYPLIFQDRDGTIKGLYIELLTEISKNENISFEYVFGTWQSLRCQAV